MQRDIRVTADGSSTVYVSGLDITYHSTHGAIQESEHIYINAGLDHFRQKYPAKEHISVFEMGFGTGLNALLSCLYATSNNISINYEAVDKYPLTRDEVGILNYSDMIPGTSEILQQLHMTESGTPTLIQNKFSLIKINEDIRSFRPSGNYDVVFYDAFAPDIQPDLWTEDIFSKLYNAMSRGAVLVTYSCKGIVKKAISSAGFLIEKLPGPKGKREILRAFKAES